MTLWRDTDARFRGLPWKVAAFVLSALLGAALAVVFFAWRQGYFEPKTPLTFVSDTGTDLRVGMSVKFSGFTIGEVSKLTLDDQGRVRIAVKIEDRYMKWLRTDSVGKVGKDGLIGDAYIDVGIGDFRKPEVQANAELEFMPSRSMDDIIREVRNRALPVIGDVEEAVQHLNAPDSDLNRTMRNLREFSEGLKSTQVRLDKTLDNLDRLTGKDVPLTLASSRQALQRLDGVLHVVEGRLPTMMDRANSALEHVDATGRATQQLIEQISPDAIGLVRDSRELSRKGNDTLDAVERSWPINRVITPVDLQPPHSDSQGSQP